MDQNSQAFISKAVIEMVMRGVSIKLIASNKVDINTGEKAKRGKTLQRVNGYFDETVPDFVCAVGKPQKLWLPVFVHEYCHFLQWKEGCKVWNKFDRTRHMEDYDDWIQRKKDLPDDVVRRLTRVSQELELDCEKRAVAIIEEFGLPLDIEDWIKGANAYLLFYEVVRRERAWSKISPYEIPAILKLMSPHWLSRYDRISKKFYRLVVTRCMEDVSGNS